MNLIYIITGTLILSTIVFSVATLIKLKRVRKDYENKKNEILNSAKREAERIIQDANIQAKEILLQARTEAEKEIQKKKHEISELEKKFLQREELLETKIANYERMELNLIQREKELNETRNKLQEKFLQHEQAMKEVHEKLERIAGMTREEAKRELIKSIEDEARFEAGKLLKKIEEETRENAVNIAQNIIAQAIQRYAGEYVAENTISVVNLPNEEMKGRIIGREGRNIRAIESACGVDIIVDDTPEAVIISSFDPLRREIAKQALLKLISDGRIHPGRIEEVVEKTTKEIERAIKEAGESAIFDTKLHGVHPELVKLIGKLKYRTSYSQNVYNHSLEVAFICGIMAAELGLNVKQAKRAALLHDIGKAVDHDVEGPHAQIGAELARKYGESPRIVEAIAQHHDDAPQNLIAVLIQAADTLSAARPGVRKESWEAYVKRIESLENIAKSIDGIEKCFAIQAGRELRVIVYPDKVSDEQISLISREIAKRIESEVTYPGQIKVTVIREVRSVDYAK